MRLKLACTCDVFRPVMEMLRQTVRRTDVREILCRAKRVSIRMEYLGGRIGTHVRVKRVFGRRFDRFVVLRKWPFREIRRVELGDTLRQHDEGAERLGTGVGLIVGNVAGPAGATPAQRRSRRVPRFAGRIRRSTVIKDASIGRPVPGPVRIKAQSSRIFLPAPGHHVPCLCE